jgi:hypothetical protein
MQEQRASCKSRMDAFGKAFLAAFEETHITHYIVRCLLLEILLQCLLSLAKALSCRKQKGTQLECLALSNMVVVKEDQDQQREISKRTTFGTRNCRQQ